MACCCWACAMRILHVVEATTAGVRRHVSTLASTTDQRRYTALIACPPMRDQAFGDAAFVAELQQMGLRVLPVPMVREIRPAADARALAALIGIIRSEHIDLVHTHSSKAGVLGRLAACAAGVASVYTPHGLFFLGLPSSPRRHVFMQIERMMACIGDRIIAVSPGEYDLLLATHIAPAERIACIENGIIAPQPLSADTRATLRAELGATNAGLLIGTVARLAAQKNPRLFLEAAAQVLQQHPAARFVWCGDGELREQAERWAHELGMANALTWLGHREDARAILAACDQFWLTSHYEGLPTVLLEAMALGVPIVATDVVGSRDVLRGGAGLLVAPGQPKRFAQAALLLAAQPQLRAAFGRTGMRLVSERWSAARMVRETEDLYATVVAERPRRATQAVAYSHAVSAHQEL